MKQIVEFLSFQTIVLLFSTAFSVLFVMVMVNIITVDDLVVILKLSPESAEILKTIFGRLHEVSNNILDIISQLLNKLFGWAGVDVDLSKIKVDTNATNAANHQAPSPVKPTAAPTTVDK
ncbi:MAG: hypothetical protein K0R25_1005 [Rickettsiaceae bacterium]|jgi:hypothetical protein|nr:hypothetical protein [Rickettsiaceae bacterium]